MRNLRNVDYVSTELDCGSPLAATAWAGHNHLICAFGPTKDNALLQLQHWSRRKAGSKTDHSADPFCFGDVLASWEAPCPLSDLDCDQVINLHYFLDVETACLVLAGGDIVVVRESFGPEEGKIEIVGSVDVGISAASWSPDEELLVITTKANTLLYMTRDFENVKNVQFTPEDFRISKHVSVGWGKSETQFKGKGAKVLRDPTVPERVDEGVLSENDARNTSISWRGDGAFVAVNSIEADYRRVIRVYSREGSLDSVSEPVNGLTGALSWRPAGNLIASIQRLSERVDVVFFERNGLRHGQFSLRVTRADMDDWAADISLAWNIDSTVLAVSYLDRVQLWTMGNYHYYLKQEIFPAHRSCRTSPFNVRWDLEQPLRLTFHTRSKLTYNFPHFDKGTVAKDCLGAVQKHEYLSVACTGPTAPPDDFGVVAVIDGDTLKVTPMRLANIPPPMALHELNLHGKAIDVAVSVTDGVTIFGVLFDDALSFYKWRLPEDYREKPALLWTKRMPSTVKMDSPLVDQERCVHRSVFFNKENRLSVLQSTVSGIFDAVAEPRNGEFRNSLVPSDDSPIGEDSRNARHWTRLRCEKSPSSMPNLVTLLPSGRLVMNGQELARNCTSFLTLPSHLVFTTSQNLLKFVHMTDPESMVVPGDAPESDERCRSIERGAKLVTVIPSIFAIVLQMPRGNLETIYPRALVLAGVRDNIQAKKYKKAFLACRNHRVDMNILHDYNPEAFIADAGLFVDQVSKVEYIDLFLSQLRNEDVTQTMYRETLSQQSEDGSRKSATQGATSAKDGRQGKVGRICNAFLDVLRRRMSTNLQNVITAHVCKVPPDLDAGLSEIARLHLQSPERAESATEHICFLADSNRLYDNALGLYNLELTLLVAQQTQKDPREYLPFLQKLQDMATLRRQYSIDDYLGRFSKAIRHLYDLDAFDEVESYVVKHTLYSQALEMYRYQDKKLAVIMRLYGEYLRKNANYKEAGIAYEYLRDYPLACESYRLAHMWRESLFCAGIISLPKLQVQSLARTLAEDRIDAKDFHSAAIIHQDYLSDIASAGRLYCKGYHFADAMRIVSVDPQSGLLQRVIDVGLVEGMATMTELLADCKSQLNAQVPRIHELREKKAEDPLAFFEGDVTGGVDIPDNVSLAPTDASTMGASLFTRYTNRTGTVATNATRQASKKRQREERKRARGKKGSVYEEEYLVNSVGRLVDRVNAVSDEVERLVVGLMRRGMRERALAVEAAMVEVMQLCQMSVDEVFPKKKVDTGTEKGQVEDLARRPTGGDGVLWDSIEGEQSREAPLVKMFSRLSLLGE